MQGQEYEYYSSKVFLQFHTLSALSFPSIYNYHVCKNHCVYYISINIQRQAIIFQKKLSSVYLSVPSRQKKYYFNSFQFSKELSMIFTYCKRICCFYNCNTIFLPLYCVQKEKYKYLATLFRGGNYNVKIYFKKIRRYE